MATALNLKPTKDWKHGAAYRNHTRIYAACLAAYNNGILHGAWIDANRDAWAIWGDISAMLRASPIPDAEEWAIHDHEGFEGVRIAESESIDRVAELAALIVDHGSLGAELIAHYYDIDAARRAIEDDYAGQYDSLADFARQITEKATEIPESLRHNIDHDSMAHDLALGDVIAIETGAWRVHVFWAR